MLTTCSDKTFYIDGYLKSAYDKAKRVIVKDWDFVFLIDGKEGGGKSVLAHQGAKYLDNSFNIERIAFTPEEFKECILKAEKYQAVVYDEAYTGLSSRSTMSDINKTLVSMLAEIRQKNLFVFIVMPTFFDLDRYAAIWRSRALINVYTDNSFGRGYFKFYNDERKKSLYLNGKKFYSYNKPSPNFRGRFTNAYVVDEAEYRRRKLRALSDHKDKKEAKYEERFKITLRALCNHVSMREATKELEALGLEITHARISQILTLPKEKAL